MDYLDFELSIGSGVKAQYPVEVIRSPGGEARASMRLPFDERALENRLQALEIALLRSGGKRRRVLSSEEQTVQDFGQTLFSALLTGDVLNRYDVSLQKAKGQDKGLRLKLHIQSAELATLPWEYLYDKRSGDYVVLSRETPLIRYLELQQTIEPLAVTAPLRILGMVASPADLDSLDVEQEKQRMEEATRDLAKKGIIELSWLAGETWEDLQREMRRGPWHVFHFIGHCSFDPGADEGLIALANKEGGKHLLTATQLGRLLANHRALRMVLLNSCEGARGGKGDLYSSTAATLVRRGIPAVIAMQYEITDRAAAEFSHAFYAALADGMPVDSAMTEARVATNLALTNSLEWGTPVLYSRSPDGVLFEVTEREPRIAVNSSTEIPRSELSEREQGMFTRRACDGLHRLLHKVDAFVQEHSNNVDARVLKDKIVEVCQKDVTGTIFAGQAKVETLSRTRRLRHAIAVIALGLVLFAMNGVVIQSLGVVAQFVIMAVMAVMAVVAAVGALVTYFVPQSKARLRIGLLAAATLLYLVAAVLTYAYHPLLSTVYHVVALLLAYLASCVMRRRWFDGNGSQLSHKTLTLRAVLGGLTKTWTAQAMRLDMK